jgi:cytochrome c biogenesis protein CcdA
LIELILIIVQVIGESFSDKKRGVENHYGMIFVVLWFVLGAGVGFLSLLVFKHSIIQSVGLKYNALLGYPLLAALASYVLSAFRSPAQTKLTRITHMLRAFGFAFGLLLVRHQHFS